MEFGIIHFQIKLTIWEHLNIWSRPVAEADHHLSDISDVPCLFLHHFFVCLKLSKLQTVASHPWPNLLPKAWLKNEIPTKPGRHFCPATSIFRRAQVLLLTNGTLGFFEETLESEPTTWIFWVMVTGQT